MEMFLDILVAVLLILGCLMSLIAGIGLLTFPDMLTRMHAATKPQVLGFLLIFAGLAIHLRSWAVVPLLLLLALFGVLVVTATPVYQVPARLRELGDRIMGRPLPAEEEPVEPAPAP